jgi:ethanolamine ammonia-lyase large subunit
MTFAHTIGNIRYTFASLREHLAKATPLRSGDVLAGAAARSAEPPHARDNGDNK